MTDPCEIRVLHVDDDRDDHLLLRDVMQDGQGPVRYRLDWVGSYDEALACLRAKAHDAYLFDYDLGGPNGMELMRAAQSMGCKAPIIILTGAGDLAVDLQALEAGAMDYLDKNHISFALLDRSIRYAIAQKRQEEMLWSIQAALESRVLDRTLELRQSNAALRLEIAERVKAETEAWHSKEFFGAILDSSVDIIWILQPDGKVVFCSARSSQLLDFDPRELTQQSVFEWMHPADRGRLQEAMGNLALWRTDAFSAECRLRHRDGRWRDFELVGQDFRKNPAVRGIVVNARDLTRRREAERALRESEVRFRDLIEGSTQGILIHHDFEPFFANRSFADLFGYPSVQAVCDEPSLAALFPDGPGVAQPHVPAATALGGERANHHFQVRAYRKDGQERALYGTARDVVWQGRPAVQSTFIDVTEVLQLEKQLRQAQKMEALGVLVAGVAHEVNNPNNYILLNTSTLQDVWTGLLPVLHQYNARVAPIQVGGVDFAFLSERIPQLLAAIADGSRRICEIVDGLKDFARVDDERDEQLLDLNEVIRSAIPLTRARIDQSTKRFEMDLTPDLPSIMGSGQRLQQVVLNLLINACDALPDPQRAIQVRTGLGPGLNEVQLQVADEGCGIDPQDLSRVCDPFFTTKPVRKGTGLGMSVSEGIVRQHKGTLEIRSIVGQGTTVTARFPYLSGTGTVGAQENQT